MTPSSVTHQRVAALYDIHGNAPALAAVLEDVARLEVSLLVIGGDVFPGPMPIECLALLNRCGTPRQWLMGNGDRETLATRSTGVPTSIPAAYHDVMRWNAALLDDACAGRIATWPATLQLSIAGLGEVLCCHATPDSDTTIVTARTSDERMAAEFGNVIAATVVCGHTHMQFDRRVGRQRIVNAGSVGMPFGAPGAYWLLLDDVVTLRHTAYDLDAAAAVVRATDYPAAEAFATGSILTPPDVESMLGLFGG